MEVLRCINYIRDASHVWSQERDSMWEKTTLIHVVTGEKGQHNESIIGISYQDQNQTGHNFDVHVPLTLMPLQQQNQKKNCMTKYQILITSFHATNKRHIEF